MKNINWKEYELSKFCLGTVQFGLDYGISNNLGQVPQEEVNQILEYVVSTKINCFDTAQAYGNSEHVIGKFFKTQNSNDIKIISKIKSELFTASSDELCAEVASSLENLFVNSLFGLLLHDSKILYNWNEKESLLVEKLKNNNLIKNFGVSIYTDEEFLLALENDKIELIQIPFNLFDQRAITKDWLKKAKEKNKLIFIRSIYLQGLLLMDIDKIPDHLKSAKKYLEFIDSLCSELGITKNELALSYVNNIAKDSIILFGCDTVEQAKENIDNFNNLTELDQKTLGNIKKYLSNISENIYNPSKWEKM